MPATALPAAQACNSQAALNPTFTAVDGVNGNSFGNNGKQMLVFKNGATPATVTLDALPTGATASAPDGLTVTDRAFAIGASETRYVGPFDRSIYNDASGNVTFTTATGGTLTVAVLDVTNK